MSTRIYTMTHKKFFPPENPVYIPLQVGSKAKEDLGYLRDDTGDHISDKNCYYGELTGLYWLWKNLDYDGNIGICHYRRYFVDENRELLQETDYDRILEEYDIITSQAITIEEPYREYFGEAHHLKDLELEGQVLQELFPEDYPYFNQAMNGHIHYFGNLMVTSRVLFDEYCEWLFSIFSELEKRVDVSGYDDYHKRLYGFLSEQLLLVWIQARGLKVYECPVRITDEKAETIEFKQAIGQLIKKRRLAEAGELYYEVLRLRPDIRLPHSDLLGEIPVIEQIIYVCQEEQNQGKRGMLDYSNDLQQLIHHSKKLCHLLAAYQDWTKEDVKYFSDTFVSEIAVEVFAKNYEQTADHWRQILETFLDRTKRIVTPGDYCVINIPGGLFEDSVIKNQWIGNTSEPILIFANQDVVTGEEILQMLTEYPYMERADVLVLCDHAPQQSDWYGILQTPKLNIYALIIRRSVFEKASCFNFRLTDDCNREFLCRAAEIAEILYLECSDVTWQRNRTSDICITNAYLLVRYLTKLQERSLLEAGLQQMTDYTAEYGWQSDFEQILNLMLNEDQKFYRQIYLATAPFFVIRGNEICYGVLQNFSDQLVKALIHKGQWVIETTEKPFFTQEEMELLQTHYFRALIGFQAPILMKKEFCFVKGIRFDFWLDHPMFFHEMFMNSSDQVYLLCQDGDHAAYADQTFPMINGIHFPPGGNLPAQLCTCTKAQKEYDISFMGTYFDELSMWDKVYALEGILGEMACFAAEYLLAHSNVSYNEMLAFLMEKYPKPFSTFGYAVVLDHLWEAFRIPAYTYRNRVVRQILDAGYELHVYGDSWQTFPVRNGDQLVIHDAVAPEHMSEELAKARIALNVMTWHKAGFTERIIEIMMAGTVCLTDETAYLKEHFSHMEDVVMFSLDHIEDIPKLMAQILENEELQNAIATKAYEKVSRFHTWDVRAGELLELVTEIEDNM